MHLVDHSAIRGSILNFNGLADSTQAQASDARLVILQAASGAFHLRDLDSCFSHFQQTQLLIQYFFNALAALGSNTFR